MIFFFPSLTSLFRSIFSIGLLSFFLSLSGYPAELTFTPTSPMVEIDKQIKLSISGNNGEVTWTAAKGHIQGTGTQVTYLAPSQTGLDLVSVLDSAGNTGMVKIVITPPSISWENAQWETFTNRNNISALLLSEDSQTLWVGTQGGLEQRDIATGEIKALFTNLNGLPHNLIQALLSDGQGGIWVGTNAGLAHRTPGSSTWETYHEDSEYLLDDQIGALAPDGVGGIWIGTRGGGLSHRYAEGHWAKALHPENSLLPSKSISSLLSDGYGGIWIGTGSFISLENEISGSGNGLVHLRSDGTWEEIFNTNSGLPDNIVSSLASDGKGGIWVGLAKGGLAHRDVRGRWEYFTTTTTPPLPTNFIKSLQKDDQGGLWIGTWEGGLAYLDNFGKLKVFNTDNTPQLLDNHIDPILVDQQGGFWIGTVFQGLIYYQSKENVWRHFNNKSILPLNTASILLDDGKRGIWVGTWGEGIAHYRADGQWQMFDNDDNPNFLDGTVRTLMNDGQGGVWIGGYGGISHLLDANINLWEKPIELNMFVTVLFNDGRDDWVGNNRFLEYCHGGTCEVMFSGNIRCLLKDDQGEIWVGTLGQGLAHQQKDGQWEFFDQSNYLPDNNVSVLISDGHGGIWVGTGTWGWDRAFSASGGGLLHRNTDGNWEEIKKNFFESHRSSLSVEALSLDGHGGLYIGSFGGGLLHLDAEGYGKTFNAKNSGLGDFIISLLPDGSGGLWIGTFANGLTHLTFTQKTTLCQTTDVSTCEALQNTKRAAIILAGGGNDEDNNLWDATESITAYLYKVFSKRGFDNDEIYYLSPQSWADFNGDGLNDNIVDAPKPERALNLEDIRAALDWAKHKGKLGQPLYIFFVDHGGTGLDQVGQLQLAKLTYLYVSDLKKMLDDYQTETGNEVVLVIDACYSGAFVQQLAAPHRAVISSAGSGESAHFVMKQGFSRFFAEGLSKGKSFAQAFGYARIEQQKLIGNSARQSIVGNSSGGASNTTQTPQLDDNGDGVSVLNSTENQDGQWLNQVHLNGHFKTGDSTLAVEIVDPEKFPAQLQVGQPFQLKAKAGTVSGNVEQVWAIIRPPRMDMVIDPRGTPIVAFPRQPLTPTSDKLFWEVSWSWEQTVYNGDYEITFYAQDNERDIASSDSVLITVTGGIDPPPHATIQVYLSKDRYQHGEPFKAQLVEELSWGYDLYAAVTMPNGDLLSVKRANEPMLVSSSTQRVSPWLEPRKQHQMITLFDLPALPDQLPIGRYCLYGILSPKKANVFETLEKGLWLMSYQCFEIY